MGTVTRGHNEFDDCMLEYVKLPVRTHARSILSDVPHYSICIGLYRNGHIR